MTADLSTISDEIKSTSVDIAWQMWSALGVSSWESPTPRSVIELEPLIAMTAIAARDDRRLLTQAIDWCAANADLISLHQMRRVTAKDGWPIAGPLAEFGATAGHFMRKSWPGVQDEEPFIRELPLKSTPPDLREPALIALRLRAVFGVGARSEIVRFMLFHPQPSTISQIAREILYGERQIAKDLRLLSLAGIARRSTDGPSTEYVLADALALEAITGRPTAEPVPWGPAFRVMTGLADVFTELATTNLRNPDTVIAARFRRLDRVLGRLNQEQWWKNPLTPTLDDIADWIPWFLEQTRKRV